MGCINSTVTPVNPNEVDNSHFQVERIIGKGGFGTIHYVIRKGNEEGFARKSQEKHRMVKHSGAVKMAFTEIDTLRLCSSPFICNMQHAYQDDKFVYIVMDLALGGDLDFQVTSRTCILLVSFRSSFTPLLLLFCFTVTSFVCIPQPFPVKNLRSDLLLFFLALSETTASKVRPFPRM